MIGGARRTPRRRLWAFVLVAATADCGAVATEEPIPRVDLTRLAPEAARQIAAAQRRVEETPPRDATALGAAFGELGISYHAYDLTSPAAACYRRACGLAPDDPRWPYLLGTLLRRDGRVDEAASRFERTSALLAADGAADRAERLAALIAAGDAELAAGLDAEAGRKFDAAMRLDPTSTEAQFGAARAMRSSGHDRQAVDLLREVLRTARASREVLNELGLALRALGDAEESRKELDLARQTGSRIVPPDPFLAAVAAKAVGVEGRRPAGDR